MRNVKLNNKDCCGCTACYSICTRNAIIMVEDGKGFKYPQINEKLCNKCGLCKKVCNFDIFKSVEKNIKCYAVKHKDDNEIFSSRSGAVFIALAELVLKQNGVVFGVEFDTVNHIIHKQENDKSGVNKFKGSKYVQSDMKECFSECEQLLIEGKKVLFSGTACQIDGLLSFMRIRKVDISSLITVDIICHGVPSPKLWRDFIAFIEKKHNKSVIAADFRDKEQFGWREHKETIIFEDNYSISMRNWTNVFYKHIMFRDSCYNCSYTTPYRNSDITIADYWGIENNVPEYDDNKGVSLVMIQSQKGKQYFEEIKECIYYKETKLESSMQPNLSHPSIKGDSYDIFWKDYSKYSTLKFMRKWFFPSRFQICINRVLRLPVRVIRKVKSIFR